jgi:hypothetical protein
LIAIAAIVLLIAGCGGGSDSGSTSAGESATSAGSESSQAVQPVTTSSLSKPDFIAKADKICQRESEHLLELIVNYIAEHKSHPGQSEEEVAAEGVGKVLAPKFQAQIDQIHELGAPAGDEKQVEALLKAMQHAVFALEKRNEIDLSTGVDREFQQAGELALDYGLETCAN